MGEEGDGLGEADRLRAYGIKPARALGQHFLLNPRLLEYLVAQASVNAGDYVLEVGAGSGALTRRLLARGAAVTAVEIDGGLCRLLREEFAAQDRFHLIEGDVLAGKRRINPAIREAAGAPGRQVKLVANLPFGSATPFVMTALEEFRNLKVAVVTVQLEVADRFVARPGQKPYGLVSVLAQSLAGIEKLKRVDKRSFWPPPKVDAAILRFTPQRRNRVADRAYQTLRDLAAWAFAQRRKKLGPRLAAKEPPLAVGELIPPGARPEDVSPATYRELARRIAAGPEA